MTNSLALIRQCSRLSRPLGVLGMTILLSSQVLWAQGTCPPRTPDTKFGLLALALATAHVGNGHLDKKTGHFCWAATHSLSDTAHQTSDGDGGHFTAEYNYNASQNNVSLKVRVAGDGPPKKAVGGGAASVSVEWVDTLTFHSNKMRAITPQTIGGTPLMKSDMIYLQVRFNSGNPQCSGRTKYFRYATSAHAAMANTIAGVGWITIPKDVPIAPAETYYTVMDMCGLPNQAPKNLVVLNGFGASLSVGASATLNGLLTSGEPHGDLSVSMTNMSLCIVRPATPDDLTLTSASGVNYWCN